MAVILSAAEPAGRAWIRGTTPRGSISGCAQPTRDTDRPASSALQHHSDGTVEEEHITHDAGGTTPQGLTTSQLVALIRETGREPVLRDTLYTELVAV
jgi:hypothetical protein